MCGWLLDLNGQAVSVKQSFLAVPVSTARAPWALAGQVWWTTSGDSLSESRDSARGRYEVPTWREQSRLIRPPRSPGRR